MKKYILYIGILMVGLLMGWLLFGESPNKKENHDHSVEAEGGQMWTCSMHPQILQAEPGDCPICGMDLIPAEAGADGLAADQFKMTKNAMALANVQTSVVGMGAMGENALKLSGKIKENEEANTVQASYFEGRVERLNVNFTGESIKKGQLLATIYSPSLVAAQQELLTSARVKESQPALYKAVRNKLKLWKLSDNQIDKIEELGKVTENVPIYATVSGTVTEKMVEEGDYVKQGQPLLKIANLNTVWAVFDAYENQIPSITKGQELAITANAYPDRKFESKISFVDPRLNTATRTVMVRAELKNKDDIFKPGMFVEGNIQVVGNQSKNVIVIPESAVLWTGERSLVYTKASGAEPIFQLREVTLGASNNGQYTILDGLKNGEEIVTNGTFTVDAAAQLQGKKSMMNSSGGNSTTGHEGHTGMQRTKTGMKMQFPSVLKENLMKLMESYLEVKDALVESNATLASQAAKKGLVLFGEFKKTKKMDEMAMGHFNKLEEGFLAISKMDILEKQREQFIMLSENMIAIGANMEKVDSPLYVQHCPMANTNKGARWLSLTKNIENPYYGESMMKCGSVVDSIE